MFRSRLIQLMLAVVMTITAVGIGVAQGAAPVAGQIVLCTGHGAKTIYIDADGNLVERVHLCPEGAAGLLSLVAEARPSAPVLMQRLAFVDWPHAVDPDLDTAFRGIQARAPPMGPLLPI